MRIVAALFFLYTKLNTWTTLTSVTGGLASIGLPPNVLPISVNDPTYTAYSYYRISASSTTGPNPGFSIFQMYSYTNNNQLAIGPTGSTGPSISYLAGNNPYAPSGSLITTTIGTTQTRIYQIGPITTLSTTKLLIMANVSLISDNKHIQMTVGRATTSGATNTNSTNITSGSTPVTLPATTPSYFMAGSVIANNVAYNLNGFALDIPGAGTFYYTIWMSSSTSHNYTEMTAVLTVLQV